MTVISKIIKAKGVRIRTAKPTKKATRLRVLMMDIIDSVLFGFRLRRTRPIIKKEIME